MTSLSVKACLSGGRAAYTDRPPAPWTTHGSNTWIVLYIESTSQTQPSAWFIILIWTTDKRVRTHAHLSLSRQGGGTKAVGEGGSHMTHYCFILCQPQYISRRWIMTKKSTTTREKSNRSTKSDWPAEPTRIFFPARKLEVSSGR